jgi:hypothetical protein
MSFAKRLTAIILVLVFSMSGSMVNVMAQQEPGARVIVPDLPGGAAFSGCYRVSQRLYGPYRMTFCLTQRGTYQVTGGGVTCNGRLDWRASGRDISVQLRRSSCGNGVAWSADRMNCRGSGLLGTILGIPALAGLRCTYTPGVRGERPMNITARRYN